MLEAARGVASLSKEILTQELKDRPDYKLLLVGHSLGGSVAAILGTIWTKTFPDTTVYCYGSACVSPLLDRGSEDTAIVSVLLDGDPFSCLSLGHVADVSFALDFLCKHPDLRATILMRTDGPVHQMEMRDLEWCSQAMEDIHEKMVGEKLYPPGRLLFLSNGPKKRSRKGSDRCCQLHDVPVEFFRYWKIGRRMFDLSRHVPRLYEANLRRVLMDRKKTRKPT
jgi:hypothetical protein